MRPAEVLRLLADLVQQYTLPPPISVSLYSKPAVQVDADHIGLWVEALGIPAPEWDDEGFARWPSDAFANMPFTLACVDSANRAVA